MTLQEFLIESSKLFAPFQIEFKIGKQFNTHCIEIKVIGDLLDETTFSRIIYIPLSELNQSKANIIGIYLSHIYQDISKLTPKYNYEHNARCCPGLC